MDYSSKQIESERIVAEREGYQIRIIQGDMTKPLPFEDEEFDLVFHPVSNCYVEEVRPIWKECYRVLKHGGYLIAGTDHYINYIVDSDEKRIVNSLPFNPLKNPEQMKQLQDEDAGVQFSHSLEEQIGGQLEAGFRLLSLYEDTNGEGRLHELGKRPPFKNPHDLPAVGIFLNIRVTVSAGQYRRRNMSPSFCILRH